MDEKVKAKRSRGRLVYVPIRIVELIFGSWIITKPDDDDGVTQFFNRAFIKDIPADAELVFISPSMERDALMLKYVHESFDEVPEGFCCPEVVVEEVTFRKIKVEKV